MYFYLLGNRYNTFSEKLKTLSKSIRLFQNLSWTDTLTAKCVFHAILDIYFNCVLLKTSECIKFEYF